MYTGQQQESLPAMGVLASASSLRGHLRWCFGIADVRSYRPAKSFVSVPGLQSSRSALIEDQFRQDVVV